ncbi:MAG: hypothetical protein GVY20_16915 [Bacteroidetes bacterium]|jgi:hypothetical protein|nr:hypothetical protein [Bacteroidota bacterium]
MNPIIFKRTKLYEEVWTKPMTELAKEYGINVYQLTKACDELEIPRPESGYWSKLRHGKKVKRKPLTESEKKEFRLNLEAIQPTNLTQLLPKGYQPLVVKDHLRNPHPLIRQTYDYLKERSKERSPGDKYGRLKPYQAGYMNVSVSKDSLKRAMRILDAVLKESIRQGFQVGTGTKYDRNHTYIKVAEDKVYVFLQEEGKQSKKENPKYSWDEYDRYTTGKLKLMISSSFYGYSSRRISDTKTQTIEERLDKFFPILLEIAEEERKNRIKREEAQRKAEIARKIREQQEREYQAEMKRREELEELSEQFTKSEYIYQFIGEVESKIEIEQLTQEQMERFNEWKKWALEHADRLNPVVQTIEEVLNQRKQVT